MKNTNWNAIGFWIVPIAAIISIVTGCYWIIGVVGIIAIVGALLSPFIIILWAKWLDRQDRKEFNKNN